MWSNEKCNYDFLKWMKNGCKFENKKINTAREMQINGIHCAHSNQVNQSKGKSIHVRGLINFK